MNLLESICNLEEEENIRKCCKCVEYRNWDTGGHCEWHDCSCDPNDDACIAFVFSEFWETKRGY